MIEVLLYSEISCTDASLIVDRIKANEYLSEAVVVELIETIQDSTPNCLWDAND